MHRSVLFVGAGRHQRSAIQGVRDLGIRVVAVDRNGDAPGLGESDIGEVVDFSDVEAVAEVGRRERVAGVMTMASDRAVPVVAAVAERLGLPGIGSQTAHAMTHKIAMRRLFAEHGVPQPAFGGVRRLSEARAVVKTVGLPAVLKPADSSGQRGVFLIRSTDQLEEHLHAALAGSSTQEAILEAFNDGLEVNTLLVARAGEAIVITASDRLRTGGIGFGVALAHLYPSTVFGDMLAEVERVAIAAIHALGLRDGIAYPQLLVTNEGVRVVEVAARIPGGQMAEVARLGVGVDLLEVAVRQALGEQVPDELVTPRFQQPLAIRFLTSEPGPLPSGRVSRVGTLDKVRAFPGVERAEAWIEPGDEIRPVQVDGDRRGYVIALAPTNLEALERADAATTLLDVEVE